jgi:hypothetical protein
MFRGAQSRKGILSDLNFFIEGFRADRMSSCVTGRLLPSHGDAARASARGSRELPPLSFDTDDPAAWALWWTQATCLGLLDEATRARTRCSARGSSRR